MPAYAALLAFVACLVALRMPWTAAWTAAAVALAMRGWGLHASRRAALALVLIAVAAHAWRTPLREVRASLDRLRDAKDRRGAAGLDTGDAVAVYGLNLAMGLGGFAAGFPEAAQETLMLCVRGPTVRTWRSDFAMRSPRVRAAVRRLAELASRRGGAEEVVVFPEVRVAWDRYAPGSDSLRVALALNSPLVLSGTAHREGGRWRLELVGRARVEYPRRSVLTLGHVDGAPIRLDEGLLWALQERGWLHPYTAEWRWMVSTDDTRLWPRASPEPAAPAATAAP